jgi:quinol---cytochrome c reductase iron-sulfur subunit, bacillus type
MMNEKFPLEKIGNSTTNRRKFLKVFTISIGGIVSFALGIPFIGTLLGRSSVLKKVELAKVTEVDSLNLGKPKRVNFLWQEEDAYIHETTVHSVWAIEQNLSDVTVFSPICPHAGCYYNWDEQSGQFQCPCHGSVFSISGKVLGGPAPRSLDTLPNEIKEGVLYVTWERFKSGVPEKIQIS